MNRSTNYCEFKLRVPIGDISDDTFGDIDVIRSLFATLYVTPPEASLDRLYEQFYDYTAAHPNGRKGRGDVLIFASDADDECFMAIDMFDDVTDQMNTVGIELRVPRDCADKVRGLLQSIRSSAEVSSALLEGDLGIKESLAAENFPRHVQGHGGVTIQHAQFFRRGCLVYATSSS
ncbi:hypothetical protein [Aeoliella sp. SH292]|uniref:hypothetical protein n=1 Tax=Aeoliella sp. SH292 TaxID=3454464 RepID=UPI003F99319B